MTNFFEHNLLVLQPQPRSGGEGRERNRLDDDRLAGLVSDGQQSVPVPGFSFADVRVT